MTENNDFVIKYQTGMEKTCDSLVKIQKIIRDGEPDNRNFRIYQVNKNNKICLILERSNWLETRYNPRFGYIIYRFMISKENKFLYGKMYFPGQMRNPVQVESKDTQTIERMRFGRSYENQKIIVEYY